MKKYILLNLSALFAFFLAACMFISCGKSKKSKPSWDGQSRPETSPNGQSQPETSLSPNPFSTEVKQKMKQLGRREKVNRIKCVNNLSQIIKAMISFEQANGGHTPWNLLPSQQRNHFGENYNLTVGSIFGLTAMKSKLQTPQILISPCDKGRFAANELLQGAWAGVNTKGGNPIPHDGLSYGLCLGADFQRSATVVAMTRNLSTDDLATAGWVGVDEGPSAGKRAVSGLTKSQGQLVLADGSAKQSTNADLGANGKIIKRHINSRGGWAKGDASTEVILPY
jgi:hypothetical protein